MKTLTSKFVYLILLLTMLASCSDDSGSSYNECEQCTLPPSSEASAWPGALGRFRVKPSEINPEYTWFEGYTSTWKDTDGVAPEKPGCHIETTEPPAGAQRFFGELCLDDVLLVETNPNVNEAHSHNDDLGAPDVFNCNTYCMDLYGKTGSCEVTEEPVDVCQNSAKCACE